MGWYGRDGDRERVGSYLKGLLIELERAEGAGREMTKLVMLSVVAEAISSVPHTSIPRSLHDEQLLLTRGP